MSSCKEGSAQLFQLVRLRGRRAPWPRTTLKHEEVTDRIHSHARHTKGVTGRWTHHFLQEDLTLLVDQVNLCFPDVVIEFFRSQCCHCAGLVGGVRLPGGRSTGRGTDILQTIRESGFTSKEISKVG